MGSSISSLTTNPMIIIMHGIIMHGGPYPEQKVYKKSQCFSKGMYKFTIYDEYGDGICCSDGRNGYYKIIIGGIEEKTGGQFYNDDSFIFNVTDKVTASPTTASPTTFSPTKKPTSEKIKKKKKKDDNDNEKKKNVPTNIPTNIPTTTTSPSKKPTTTSNSKPINN